MNHNHQVPLGDGSRGPSLKYSSSSYDTQIGYQSRLEITVAGNGTTTAATSVDGGIQIHGRQRPNSCYNMPVIADGSDRSIAGPSSMYSSNQPLRGGVSMPNVMAHSGFLEEGSYLRISAFDIDDRHV